MNGKHMCLSSTRIVKVIGLGLLATCLASHHVFAADTTQTEATVPPKHANFAHESASEKARHVADWVVDSDDNHKLPFLIVDKENAKVFVFDAGGQLKGAAAALLGMAVGDDTVPGIGQRKLSTISADERTTPAGRFAATLGPNLHNQEILWVDYDAGIALHRVVTSNPKERRAERLASPTIEDNRISFGCINVSVSFYKKVVSPAFKKANGIVYILPETRSPEVTFGSYDVATHVRQPVKLAPTLVHSAGDTIKLR